MAISVDPQEFEEWKRGLRGQDDDKLHAFRAIKTLAAIKFILTTVLPDEEAALAQIREVVDEWH